MEASLFAKLPGEIRNHIYELALYQPSGITAFTTAPRPHLFKPTDTGSILALTQTCKAIREESSTIFYEANKFILITKYLGEQYDGGENRSASNTGLCVWLDLLGKQNTNALSHVEIDIGTSFLYNYVPSTESIWRSIAAIRDHFHEKTLVTMKTELDWTYESMRAFSLTIPLSDAFAAKQAVDEAIAEQKGELEPWCQKNHAGPRRTEYMRVELATCAQELQSFVNLLEIMNSKERLPGDEEYKRRWK